MVPVPDRDARDEKGLKEKVVKLEQPGELRRLGGLAQVKHVEVRAEVVPDVLAAQMIDVGLEQEYVAVSERR